MATSSGLEPREITIELDKEEVRFKAQPGRFRVDRRTGEMPDFRINNTTDVDAEVRFPQGLVLIGATPQPVPAPFIVRAGQWSDPLLVNVAYGEGVVEYDVCMRLAGTKGPFCLKVEGGSRPGIEIRR